MERKNELIYRNASYIMHKILEDPRSGKNVQMGIDLMENVCKYVASNEITASMIVKIFAKHYELFSHSIQVALLAVTFCRFIRTDASFMLNCAIGAMLHDVGKIEIPHKILYKAGNLSEKEFELIKKHPEFGLNILKHHSQIEKDVLDVVYQHHESADGNGYPQKLKLKDIGYPSNGSDCSHY